MLAAFVRGGLVVVGLGLMLLGLVSVIAVDPVGGLWLVGTGGFLVVVAVIERHRYRSASAERSGAAPGPGGGETASPVLEPRFQPTAEVFVDPTSGRRMRVLVDPGTGERRYVAEA
jgi:hypothetical protein